MKESPVPSKNLDARDLLCPLPVLKARKALKSMNPGDILHILATDPMAAIDIPHMCQEDGHTLTSQKNEGDVLSFEITRG